MKISLVPLAVLLVIGGIALADEGNAPTKDGDKFKITTMRKDDAVEVQADKDKTVFDVKSPFGKEENPLNEKNPFWTDIRIIGGDGKPAKEIPLKDGYFEMTLPQAFFDSNPKSATLNWIDFYRN